MLSHGVETVEYIVGQRADLYVGQRGGPAVMLWHGKGPDEREVLAPLASAIADLGTVVVVPDWRSDASDGGRAHLLASLEWMRDHAADVGAELSRWALVGWSRGGRCALGMVLADCTPLPAPTLTVALAADTELPDPVWGISAREAARQRPPAHAVALVHGVLDPIVRIDQARGLQQVLQTAGAPAELHELPTDHAGVIGMVYDPTIERCVPSLEEEPRRAIRLIAAIVQAHLDRGRRCQSDSPRARL